jgi:hypothetical protein
MTNIYDKDTSQGFMSTSNILLPQFGNFHMKIYIPVSTPVLIRNISKETKIKDVYEIVLPENTVLQPLGQESSSTYNLYVLQPQIGSGHRKPHFYVNPLTGRVIKSNGSVYKNLKKRRFKLEEDTCLYNITSARNCLTQILNKYGGKVYPSSNFIDIPSTYHKRNKTKKFKARAFIKKDKKIQGYVDKDGQLIRLPKPIKISRNVPEVKTIKEHTSILDKKLETDSKIANKHEIEELKEQLNQEPLSEKITILHNPVQDDFIPIKGDLNEVQKKELFQDMNRTLIPTQLPALNKTNISAVFSSHQTNKKLFHIFKKNISCYS